MIAYLSGSVVSIISSRVILDVNGVGYGVQLSREDRETLQVRQPLEVFVYEHIQEKAHELYGFKNHHALSLFEDVIAINGIGPKAGLAILDLGSVATIKQAIASGNAAYVAGASGVGKKTAERVIVELRDKLSEDALLDKASSSSMSQQDEAVEALLVLGYSNQQALEALSRVEAEGTEERVKAALRELS